MKAAVNNVWQKAGEDEDFLAALVWADTWRFILHGEVYETTSLPTWVLLHSVVSWHVEDAQASQAMLKMPKPKPIPKPKPKPIPKPREIRRMTRPPATDTASIKTFFCRIWSWKS